ncbi:MAG: porin [Thalassovita sp.]|nr:porin [Thalassovita sp.]
MKTILFATTALVASAGIAAADISFSGSAQAGIANEEGVKTDIYSFADLKANMSGESDNGISFGASITISAGNEKYDIGDWEFDGSKDNTTSLGDVWIAAGGAKLAFEQEDIDDLYEDDNDSHDVQFSYSMGAISVDLTYDANEDSEAASATNAEYSYSLGYSANGLTASVVGNDLDDQMYVKASYAVNDMLTVGAKYDLGGGTAVTTVSVDYAANGFSAGIDVKDNDDWDLDLGYTAGAISIAAETDESDAWEVTGAYDFGGGLSAVAGLNADDDYYLGVKMSF